MKLACKKYGDAWTAGDRHALMECVTDDFASVWSRMPPALFASLPKSSGGDSEVIDSQKSPGGALVRVRTADGVVTFQLVGQGFQWRVSDVLTKNENEEIVSLKQSLDASLAAREFLEGLNNPLSSAWNQCLSHSMHASMAAIPPADWQRIRKYLPSIPEPSPSRRPNVRFFGPIATIQTHVASASGHSTVKVSLVREAGWRVDDLEIVSAGLNIPSFRNGAACLACVATLGEFFQRPNIMEPKTFVAPGKLRDELVRAHRGEIKPPKLGDEQPKHVRISDGAHVYLQYPNRWVLVSTQTVSGRRQIADVQLHEGGSWKSAADLLALHRNLRGNSLGNWLAEMASATATR
jgi:hypothetical protein